MSDRWLLSELEQSPRMLESIGHWRRRVGKLVDGKSFRERERIYPEMAEV